MEELNLQLDWPLISVFMFILAKSFIFLKYSQINAMFNIEY